MHYSNSESCPSDTIKIKKDVKSTIKTAIMHKVVSSQAPLPVTAHYQEHITPLKNLKNLLQGHVLTGKVTVAHCLKCLGFSTISPEENVIIPKDKAAQVLNSVQTALTVITQASQTVNSADYRVFTDTIHRHLTKITEFRDMLIVIFQNINQPFKITDLNLAEEANQIKTYGQLKASLQESEQLTLTQHNNGKTLSRDIIKICDSLLMKNPKNNRLELFTDRTFRSFTLEGNAKATASKSSLFPMKNPVIFLEKGQRNIAAKNRIQSAIEKLKTDQFLRVEDKILIYMLLKTAETRFGLKVPLADPDQVTDVLELMTVGREALNEPHLDADRMRNRFQLWLKMVISQEPFEQMDNLMKFDVIDAFFHNSNIDFRFINKIFKQNIEDYDDLSGKKIQGPGKYYCRYNAAHNCGVEVYADGGKLKAVIYDSVSDKSYDSGYRAMLQRYGLDDSVKYELVPNMVASIKMNEEDTHTQGNVCRFYSLMCLIEGRQSMKSVTTSDDLRIKFFSFLNKLYDLTFRNEIVKVKSVDEIIGMFSKYGDNELSIHYGSTAEMLKKGTISYATGKVMMSKPNGDTTEITPGDFTFPFFTHVGVSKALTSEHK